MADIFSKIIRDYNNELESILEKKGFESDVKSLLLSMLYRIENGYDDYKKVKVDVCSKNQYVKEILETISKKCRMIEIIKPMTDEGKKLYDKGITSIVDKESGSIRTFQNEKSILDAIIKMRQEDIEIKPQYELYKEPLREMLLIGNNINSLEVITDFNGWSWDTTTKSRKETVYSYLYNMLVLLIGNSIIDGWVNKRNNSISDEVPSNLILSSKYNESYGLTKKEIIAEKKDYIKEIKNYFKEIYGQELEEEFFKKYIKIAMLEYAKENKEYNEMIVARFNELNRKLKGMSDNRKFTETLSKKKKDITKEIQKIDKILSNEKELKREYEKKNEKLPKEEKIFSVSHFKLMLKKQREKMLNEIKQINKKMEPKEFVKIKNDLEDKIEFYNDMNIEDKTKGNIERLQKDLEETFIKCFDIKINKSKTNEELERLIYELRYYKLIPTRASKGEIDTTELERKLIRRACQQKLLVSFSENNENTYNGDETNYMILKEIFTTRIIDLDTMMILLKYSKGILTLDMYDGETNDQEKQLKLTEKIELVVKLNKKIKLWQ